MSKPEELISQIISIEKVTTSLGFEKNDLIEAVRKTNIQLIILPKKYFSIGIRRKFKITESLKENLPNNPLNIKVEQVDGFIPYLEHNSKILYTLNWKNCEPLCVVKTDDKNEFATTMTPQSFAGYIASQQPFNRKETEFFNYFCKIVGANLKYTNQEFFFEEKSSTFTELCMEEIFIDQVNFDALKSYSSNLYGADFKNLGGYELNSWSNQLLADINAIHNYLLKEILIKKKGDKEKKLWEARVKSCLAERWKKMNNVSKECYIYLPKIVTEQLIIKIDFACLEKHEAKGNNLNYERLNRNRKEATDLIILLDIAAEKHRSKTKGFENAARFYDTLNSLNITNKTLQQALYSVIKAK